MPISLRGPTASGLQSACALGSGLCRQATSEPPGHLSSVPGIISSLLLKTVDKQLRVCELDDSGGPALSVGEERIVGFRVGEWVTLGQDEPGAGSGTAVFTRGLQDQVILRTSYAESPPAGVLNGEFAVAPREAPEAFVPSPRWESRRAPGDAK